MNNAQKMMTVAAANLLALGMPAMAQSHLSDGGNNNTTSTQMGEAQLRALEGSHLEVSSACKWGHAAFEPVKVESELLTPEVQALHTLVG